MLHVTRKPDRQNTEREKLDTFLDDQWWGVLSVRRDGPSSEADAETVPAASPGVITIPTLFVRDGDRILVHGSTGAGTIGTRNTALAGGAGRAAEPEEPGLLPVSFCVSAMDDLILAHTTFDSSVNYRSAVLYGHLEAAAPRDREALLTTFTDRLVPGRNAEVRAMSRKEIAATNVAVLRIIDGQWIYKERTDEVDEPEEETSAWGGIVPIVTSYGTPRTASWAAGREIPPSVTRLMG